MASNGGTLHGGPQIVSGGHHSCTLCGLVFESTNSLQVHMHYHHEGGRWGATTPTSSSTTNTTTALNQNPSDTENNNQPVSKHLHIKSSNSPIAAAADSSDQPGTPQPEQTYSPSNAYQQQQQHLHADMHPYPPAYLNYDQYYHPHNIDYGSPLPPPPLPQHHQQQHQEYKTVPSRYHPYNNNQIGVKNGMSPKVVSSSGGSPLEMFGENTSGSPTIVPPGQPTPSPSPKQCDKCGTVCETDGQLIEHCARAHPPRTEDELETGYFVQQPYITPKEEPGSDILDLDSQKMVYPQHPMMHLQSMQRHNMMWEPATFQAAAGFKTEYPPTPPIKSEFNQKMYNGSEGEGPQDFPSTTTPASESGTFRQFEPPSSSLPVKSASWKSNEARRPKTYNCTACNKWFTSSGHLKRHYNTTLHKNAVKSSGAPDPALTPISHHHHPNRDPNYSGKVRRSQAVQQTLQQPVPPPEPPIRGSPDYQTQYSLNFGTNQGFQQYNHHQPINGGHPNGVAGPSVLASQPRGLLIYSSNNHMVHQQQMQQEILELLPPPQHHPEQQSEMVQLQLPPQQQHTIIINNSPPTIMPDSSGAINTTEHYSHHHHHNPLTINTNIQSYQVTQSEEQNYPHIIGNSGGILEGESATTLMEVYQYPSTYRYDRNMYQGDMAPPFSPNTPQDIFTITEIESRASTPMQAAMAPSISPAPCSPSVTSSTPTRAPKKIAPEPKKTGEFRCHQCDKIFNKICYLTQHNKTFHSGDKPFKCSRCGKRFPCEESSEEHFQKHAGDKPFKCEICPKQFNHKTDLRRHMCIHTGSKPFCCVQCGKGFIRKDHMIKHTETHRKKETMLANKKAAARNRLFKKVHLIDTNTSGSDISNASSCKIEPMVF